MRLFGTSCTNPKNDKKWEGPNIPAEDWDQAELRALSIEHWLNKMDIYTGLHVDGQIVEIIHVNDDMETQWTEEYEE